MDTNKNIDCIFCSIPEDRIIRKYSNFFIIRDAFPVTYLHTLVISNRHVESYFDLHQDEIGELNSILTKEKNFLTSEDKLITGFNIGINIGKDAGQTIMHTHIHLIPRRTNDVKKPKGGVRGVIPEKQAY